MRTRRARPAPRSSPAWPRRCPSPPTAARPTSSRCARASSTATAAPSRPATSRTRSSACSCWAACWSFFYSPIIEGAEEFQKKPDVKARHLGHRDGRQDRQITIKLTEPDTKILFALAEPYAAPTPAAKSPGKSLKQPPPGVGPYILDVKDFNRLYELDAEPELTDIPGIPKGNFDKITGHVTRQRHEDDAGRDHGKLDFMTEDPTGDQLPEVRQKYADRYSEAAEPAERLLLLPERHDSRRSTSWRRARP